MKKEDIIQIKNFIDETFYRFDHLEEFNISEVNIPEDLSDNGEEFWFNNLDLRNILTDLENKEEPKVKEILFVMVEAMEIYSDWHCEYLEDYEGDLPAIFNEVIEFVNYDGEYVGDIVDYDGEKVKRHYTYTFSSCLKNWLSKNYNY